MRSDPGEPSWQPPSQENDSANRKETSGQDIQRALEIAERWLVDVESDLRRSRNLQVGILVAFAVAAASLLGLGIALSGSGAGTYKVFDAAAVILAVSASVTGAFIMRQLYLQRSASQSAYKMRAATELATMVDAAYLEVAERENWSYVRLNSTKLRLAAFSLGTRSPSKYQARG